MPTLNSFKRSDNDENDDTRGLLASEVLLSDEGSTTATATAESSTESRSNANHKSTKEVVPTEVPKTIVSPNENNASDSNSEDEEEKATVSYFSLYRYSNKCEKFLVIIALSLATLTSAVIPLSNLSFGQFTKIMVDYASNASRQCPPPDTGQTSPFMKNVEMFALYQSSLAVFQFVAGYLFVMCLNYVAEKQVYKIRQEYFRKLLQQDISWFDKNAKRDFSSRMVDDMLKIQNAMSEKVGMFSSSIFNTILLTVMSFYLGWKLTLALMAFIPVLGVLTAFDASVQSSMTTKEQDAYADAGSIAEEVLTNIRTVHAFNGQSKEIKRYDEKILHAMKVAFKRHFLCGLGNGLTWFVSLANFAYAFWYGSVLTVNSRETGDGLYGPDNILVILFGVMMAGFYFGSSSDYIESIGAGIGAASAIYPLLDRESEINSLSEDGIVPTNRAKGEIEFKSIGFSYPSRSTVTVLDKVSFRVKAGQTVALVGSSGCGKSTCVQLLQRFYDPVVGSITLDGVDIRLLNIKWLRSQMGVVGQEPVLFNMTIAENITFGLKDISREQVEEAAKQAYAHNFIMQLPQGYDTRVGERGTSLSGGQKQRVAIARALVRNPSVLLLDEATSALDFQSESIVQSALERASQGRSTIIIAHRLSTIKAADLICVVDNGNIIEQGTHSELMQLRGRYYSLVLNQEENDILQSKETQNLEEEDDEDVEERKDHVEEYMTSEPSTGKITSRTRLISQTSIDDIIKSPDTKEDDDKEVSGAVSLFRLWKGNMKEWPYLVVVFLCSIIKGLQMPAYAFIFGDFIQSFTSKDDTEVVYYGRYYCFLYLFIGGVVGISGFLQLSLVGISGERFTYRIRKLLFSSLLEQDISFYDQPKNTVGKLAARLSTDASSIRGATGSRLTGLLQAFSIVIAAGGMSFYYLPNMAAVTIVFVPVMLYISMMEGRVIGSGNVVERDSVESACNVAVEALSNIRTVASLGVEEEFMKMYAEALTDAHRINIKRSHVRGIIYGAVNGGPLVCYCMSLWYGGYLVEQKCASIGNVFKVAEALIYCTMSGGAAISYAPDYEKGKIAAARIFQLLDFTPVISRFSPNITLGTVKGHISFDNVNFRYETRPTVKVLKSVRMDVKQGESVAICGPSGSGKSTCAALIFRFYDPVTGTVKLDGFDLKRLNLDFIRQQIALVSQEPILFDCSIKENIAYGDNTREIDMSEIIEAAKATNMHNFISSLPAGYDTRVGMLGNQMSGGQKQRIAIARAIVRQPKLLVLDEATSALDSESEVAVQAALDSAKTGRSSVTIAHRLSSIINSDKIFVMKSGRIEECGTHAELIHIEGGIYQAMWNAQSSQKDDRS